MGSRPKERRGAGDETHEAVVGRTSSIWAQVGMGAPGHMRCTKAEAAGSEKPTHSRAVANGTAHGTFYLRKTAKQALCTKARDEHHRGTATHG